MSIGIYKLWICVENYFININEAVLEFFTVVVLAFYPALPVSKQIVA